MLFKQFLPTYSKGASGALILFDITNRESFEDLPNWVLAIESYVGKDKPFIILGNKVDLKDTAPEVINEEEIQAYINELNNSGKFKHEILFMYTSAKTGENVNKAFEHLVDKILEDKGVVI